MTAATATAATRITARTMAIIFFFISKILLDGYYSCGAVVGSVVVGSCVVGSVGGSVTGTGIVVSSGGMGGA